MLTIGDRKVGAAILNFLEWVRGHLFEEVLAVATILFVPCSILTFATGYAFGRTRDSGDVHSCMRQGMIGCMPHFLRELDQCPAVPDTAANE